MFAVLAIVLCCAIIPLVVGTCPLDESLPTSTEVGMRPLMEPVLSRRDILKA